MDLLRRVIDPKDAMTVNGACVAMGWRKPTLTVVNTPDGLAAAAARFLGCVSCAAWRWRLVAQIVAMASRARAYIARNSSCGCAKQKSRPPHQPLARARAAIALFLVHGMEPSATVARRVAKMATLLRVSPPSAFSAPPGALAGQHSNQLRNPRLDGCMCSLFSSST